MEGEHLGETATVVEFVARWVASGAGERANYQLFLSELCDVLGVACPDPAHADDAQNAYVFERAVRCHSIFALTRSWQAGRSRSSVASDSRSKLKD